MMGEGQHYNLQVENRNMCVCLCVYIYIYKLQVENDGQDEPMLKISKKIHYLTLALI